MSGIIDELVEQLDSFRNSDKALLDKKICGKDVDGVICKQKFLGIYAKDLRIIINKYKKMGDHVIMEIYNNLNDNIFEYFNLKGILINYLSYSFEEKMNLIEEHLKKAQSWANVDCLEFKEFSMGTKTSLDYIIRTVNHNDIFVARHAIVQMLKIDKQYPNEVIKIYGTIVPGHYYKNMAVAWAISHTILYNEKGVLGLLETQTLDKFIQNKSISKIRESFRVSDEVKDKVKQYKIG